MEHDNELELAGKEEGSEVDIALLQKQVQDLKTRLDERDILLSERDSQLAEIYMSKEWKLAQLFCKLLSWLVPPNSFRRRLWQMALSAILDIDFFWNLLFLSQKPARKKTNKIPAMPQRAWENGLKPKIGYVIAGTAISGGVAVICEHVNRLKQRGYDVSIISEDNLDRIAWFPGQQAAVIPVQQIVEDAYDILVATGWTTTYTVQRLTANRKFYFVQSDESRFYPAQDFRAKRAKKTYNMDFEFLTMARWLQNWLEKEFGKSATYIPNSINEKIIFADKPIEIKGGKIRVLLEGSINSPLKGMEDAFMAVNGLNCEVWCVSSSGTPKPEWNCDKFFSKVHLGKMRHIYSSCDILLKMSRVESFCYPPLEMMACGGTAVIGQVTGIEEYAIDGYNALIVPTGDIKAAHDALKRLIEDNELRSRLSENGKKTAEKFRWDASIDKLEKMFLEKPTK